MMIRRHILKAVSYRILGSLQTVTIGYILSQSFIISGSIGLIELCVKPIIYFLHERFWYKYIKYGVENK